MNSVVDVIKDELELKHRTCSCCDKPATMKIYLGNEICGHKQTQSITLCDDHALELSNKIQI